MGIDDKAWRALEAIARELNARSPEAVARDASRKAVATAKAIGVRALDRFVSRLAGRRVDTAPRVLPSIAASTSYDGAWMRRAVTGVDARVEVLEPAALPPVEAPTVGPLVVDALDEIPPREGEAADVMQTEAQAPAEVEAEAERRTEPQAEPQPQAHPAAISMDFAEPAAQTPEPTTLAPPEPPPTISADFTPAETLATPTARPSDAPPGLAAPRANEPLPALPPRYGIDRVVLLAGESEWVFAYWETAPARCGPHARAELRLLAEDGALVGRAYVDPSQGRQHLRVPARGRRYRAELVRLDGTVLSTSRDVLVRSPESA